MPQLKNYQAKRVNSPLLYYLFYLFRPLTEWMMVTHTEEAGREQFTQSTDPNVTLIKKHFHRYTQKNVESNIWVLLGPVKLTHESNITARFLYHYLKHKAF